MDKFQFSGLKLRKLPNYVQHLGSNNVEGVAESSVEVEMSWVEVDGAGWSWVHGLVIPLLCCSVPRSILFHSSLFLKF